MAKTTEAVYECVNTCTFNMPLSNGESYAQLYRAISECDREEENSMAVPAGTPVPKHFIPKNDQAKKDRDAQIESPAKFIQTKEHMSIIAGILVKEGMFNNIEQAIEAVKESAKEEGIESDKLGECSAEETKRIAALDELMSRGKDAKEQRKVLGAILKDGGVKFFAGAAPDKLAELVYDNELYK